MASRFPVRWLRLYLLAGWALALVTGWASPSPFLNQARGLSPLSSAGVGEPVVHVYVFLSPGCPSCEVVEGSALRALADRLHVGIVARHFNVDDVENYKILLALERRLGDEGNDLPVAIVGERVLGGTDEIEAALKAVVAEGALAGGVPAVPLPTAREIAQALKPQAPASPIHVTYFDSPGCSVCDRAEVLIEHLAGRRLADVTVRKVTVTRREDRLLLEVLSERAGLPAERRLVTPVLFVARGALVAEEITDEAVSRLLAEHSAGAPAPAEPTAEELISARSRLSGRFARVGVLAVVVGGLVDGVNPCAFAALIFFVGYLTTIGRGRRDLLVVGVAFILAVYCAYFLVGLGLMVVLGELRWLPTASLVLTYLIAALCFVLGGLSLGDFFRARRGEVEATVLKLPASLRRRTRLLIAREFRRRTVLGAALVLGFLVSLLELVCTGQIYLPLLQFMVSFSETRGRALLLLVLYNGAFVFPLLVILGTASAGASSERLRGFLRDHLALTKLATAALFVSLGTLLVMSE